MRVTLTMLLMMKIMFSHYLLLRIVGGHLQPGLNCCEALYLWRCQRPGRPRGRLCGPPQQRTVGPPLPAQTPLSHNAPTPAGGSAAAGSHFSAAA